MDCRVKPGNDRDRFNLKKNALELQPRRSGKIDVGDDLLRDQGIELLRGKRHRFDPLWGELCLYRGERQRFLHLGAQSVDDGSRGLRRHQHPVPEAVIGVGIPSSIVVGTFGRAGERFSVLSASGSRRASAIKDIADEMPMKQKSTRPLITSVSAAGPPLNGTCVALTPAESRKRSAAQWVALPTPADAKVIAPPLARSTSSLTVLIPASIRLDPLQAEQERIPRTVCGPLLLPDAL